MSILTVIISTKAISILSPQKTAIAILVLSMSASILLFKASMSSWMSFILILTFASGMMILFVYATTLAPNEKTAVKKSKKWMIMPILIAIPWTKQPTKTSKESMKTFSSQTTLILMAGILLITMLALASQSFHPTQTASASF